MVDGAPTSDPSKEPTQHEELPDRLRVHQLARSLGNTNKEVLDALFQLDGQARNVQSGVDREDALRVRDMLFAKAPAVFPTFNSARLPQPRNPSRGRRRPRQSGRTTCRCSFLRNRDRWTRTPKTMLPTAATTWMPTTKTTKSRTIGRPIAGGAVAVGVAAGDVANRPDPTAPTLTRPNGRRKDFAESEDADGSDSADSEDSDSEDRFRRRR